MCLATVMRLVIEEVIERWGEHLLDILWVDDRTETDRFGEIVLAQRADIVPNAFVFCTPRRAQLREIVEEYRIETRRDSALAGETAHPDAIPNQKVVECAMQRLEEGPPIGAVVRIRDLGSSVVKALVAPGIVTGEHMVAGQHSALLQ